MKMIYANRYLLDFIYWVIITGIVGTMFLLHKEREDICLVLILPLLFFIILMAINWYKARQQKKGAQ